MIRWLLFITIALVFSCKVNKYYTCVVIEKSEYSNKIQAVVLGSDSLHFIHPNLTLDESDSIQLWDTITIDVNNLKMISKYEGKY